MRYLDEQINILNWGSEEIAIPYRSPIDGRIHKYYPDFVVTKINTSGIKETSIIEVKPAKQTKPPEKKSKITNAYLIEVKTWGINEAKWKAANEYCKNMGWTFHIFTEKELGINF
jgi:hypothetical protein